MGARGEWGILWGSEAVDRPVGGMAAAAMARGAHGVSVRHDVAAGPRALTPPNLPEQFTVLLKTGERTVSRCITTSQWAHMLTPAIPAGAVYCLAQDCGARPAGGPIWSLNYLTDCSTINFSISINNST